MWWSPSRSRGAGRGWFILLLGIVVFAAFGGVVGYAYLKGLPGIGGEPPLIRADAEPYRRAPERPRRPRASPTPTPASSTVLAPAKPTQPRVERVLPPETAPPLEATEPEPTRCRQSPEQPSRLRDAAETASADDVAPMAPEATSPAASAALSALEAAAEPSSSPRPARRSRPDQRPATPSRRAPIEPAAPPVADAAAPPPAARGAPVAQRARTAVPQPRRRSRQSPPAQPRAAAPPPAPPPATEPAAAGPGRAGARRHQRQRRRRSHPVGAGVYRLQLAAVRSEGGLTQAWADLRQRYPAALGVGQPAGRADRHHLRAAVPPAGRAVHRAARRPPTPAARSGPSGGQCFIVGPIAPVRLA